VTDAVDGFYRKYFYRK